MNENVKGKSRQRPFPKTVSEILFLLLVILLTFPAGEAQGQKKWQKTSVIIDPVICNASDETGHSFIPPPEGFINRLKSGKKTSDIVLKFLNVPDSARAAFEYAAGIWEYLLSSPVPIYMEVNWEVLPRTTLGSCGSARYLYNFDGAPLVNTYYPVAAVEKITAREISGPGSPDMIARFNSSISWYTGTDGKTPYNKYDLVSIVLHELAHGLGFNGFFQANTTQKTASYGYGDLMPTAYDRYLENFNAGRLTNVTAFRNPSAELYQAITSGQLYSGSPVAYTWGLSNRPRLYAPAVYSAGSSIYHLDDAVYHYGDINALMTSAAGMGEATHSPGPLAAGILADLGWKYLYIRYTPLKDMEEISGPLEFHASFISDLGITNNSAMIVYSYDNFDKLRDSVSFEAVDQNGNYAAKINPGFTRGKISYFLTAKDSLGRKFVSPYTYPDSLYTVTIGPDTLKPVIAHQPVKYILSSVKTFDINALVTDNTGIDSVWTVFYAKNGMELHRDRLIKGDGDMYHNQFDIQDLGLQDADSVRYAILAVDIAKIPNTARKPLKGTFAFKLENISGPVTEYLNDFETRQTDFILSDFIINREFGFDSYALNTPHPYPSPDRDDDSLELVTILRVPVILNAGGVMSFDEVVLVEPGEPGAVFGTPDFYDYVIAEGSKDRGKSWLPLLDGYDSNSYDSWKNAYNKQISGNNSLSVGTKDLFMKRRINMTANGNFKAGDTLLIRFRLHSDPYGHGWGWIIDNLNIQNATGSKLVTGLSPGQVEIWPNPAENYLNLRIGPDNMIHELDIELIDLTGRVLLRKSEHEILPPGQVNTIDISNIPGGLYLIRLWADHKLALSKKIIKPSLKE